MYIIKNLFLLVFGLAVCQNWTVQVCTSCEHSFDWHPYCENFDAYSNDEGYFVANEADIYGLDREMREEIRVNLLENHEILLNSSIKVFNSITRMMTSTRSFMYTSTRDGVVPLPLCDLASAPITESSQRQQCSLCASVHNYDYIEFENSCCVDLSTAFFHSAVTVLYRKDTFSQEGESFFSVLLNPQFVEAIRNIICWIMLYALLIWFCNREIFKDKEKAWEAQWSRQATISIWLAVTTFTTVGYGDYVVNRRFSRILTILYMFGSMIMISYLIGVVLDSISNGAAQTHVGLEDASQIVGKNICIPGYNYFMFEDVVRNGGGIPYFKDSFDDCVVCLTEPDDPVCMGNAVAGVLYDYPVIAGWLRNKTEVLESLAVAELGVFPHCENCINEVTFHWVIPDRRYLKEDAQLPSYVYDIILDEISQFVGSDDFPLLLPEFELETKYKQINTLYRQNLSNNVMYDYILLIESGILSLCCIIIFCLGKFHVGHELMTKDFKKPSEVFEFGHEIELGMSSSSEKSDFNSQSQIPNLGNRGLMFML